MMGTQPRNVVQLLKRLGLQHYQVIKKLLISDIFTMISGIQLASIKPKDLYLRFTILEKILSHKDKFIQPSQTANNAKDYAAKRYYNLVNQLEALEKNMRAQNSQYLNNQLQTNLILTDLEKEFQRCLAVAEKSANQYEGKMLQTWRDGIKKKQEKQKSVRNQSQSKNTNNKNLMLLTSQLLKNERNAKISIKSEEQKLLEEIQKIRNTLMTKRQEFDSQMEKADQLLNKRKLDYLYDQEGSLQNNETMSLQPALNKIRSQVSREEEERQRSFSEISNILDDLKKKIL